MLVCSLVINPIH